MTQQPSGSSSSGLTDNVAAAICYVIGPFAAIFLFIAPYSTNKTVRFHAFQSLFLSLGLFALNIVLSTLASTMYAVPGVGVLLYTLLSFFGLAVLALVIVLAVRAYQGSAIELPFIGPLARQQAGA